MVYVGSPTENAYDTNRRWFSEVLEPGQPLPGTVRDLRASSRSSRADTLDLAATTRASRRSAATCASSSASRPTAFAPTARPARATGFNTKDGAAAPRRGAGRRRHDCRLRDRRLSHRALADRRTSRPAAARGPRPASRRPCTSTSTTSRTCSTRTSAARSARRPASCNLAGNVLVAGNADNANLLDDRALPDDRVARRSTSPSARAAPGTKNAQGIDQETASRTVGRARLRHLLGLHGPRRVDLLALRRAGLRARRVFAAGVAAPDLVELPRVSVSSSFNPDPLCYQRPEQHHRRIGVPGRDRSTRCASMVTTLSQGWRFGGTNLGNTRGTYFDNLRVGLVRGGERRRCRRTSGTVPGPVPLERRRLRRATTRRSTRRPRSCASGLNIVAPASDPGVVAGDSILRQLAVRRRRHHQRRAPRPGLPHRSGPGQLHRSRATAPRRWSTGIRRIRSSPRTWRTTARSARPAATAARGTGTSGTRRAWTRRRSTSIRSSRAASAARSARRGWARCTRAIRTSRRSASRTTCASWSIRTGATDSRNIDCSGTPPAVYGAVSGTTKEGTKILPDGWFTPGTHIEYFVRRSTHRGAGARSSLLFDTTNVFTQDPAGNPDFDAERWSSASTSCLTCGSRAATAAPASPACSWSTATTGAEPSRVYRGAADSLGYGKNNGAIAGLEGPRRRARTRTIRPASSPRTWASTA